MSQIFPYLSGQQDANQGLVIKAGSDQPSVYVDFADGLLSSATTITTISAIALGSTGAVTTATVVGTTGISGTVGRVDLQTCGVGGTAAALTGDRFKMTVTCTPSIGGPLSYPVFIYIEAPGYNVS
jgi:hypothetical protein